MRIVRKRRFKRESKDGYRENDAEKGYSVIRVAFFDVIIFLMKIQFDFPRRKGSLYADLLEDYTGRMREFAKIGSVKGDALELCFVYGSHLDQAPEGCLLELSSEALSESIRRSLNSGVSNIRIKVRHISKFSPAQDPAARAPLGIVLLRAEIGEDFAEVLAAEQTYRAFMIYHNRKYHK